MTDNSITNGNKKKKINKRIQDPIHGLMEFEDWIVKFIDTEHIQRLRYISQLGTVYYVYPGSSHNRFEHSLGVAHLARSLMERINKTQPEIYEGDKRLYEKDLKCVTLAGLCHDLGHGPLSHFFEKDFMPLKRPGWKHEESSVMMFKDLIDKHGDIIGDLDKDDERLIIELIAGNHNNAGNRKKYLFDIVANNRSSIDVDKFDYLARDCHYLGMKSVFDPSRLMNYSRVIDDQIAYNFKESYNIYELFHTRYSLHKKAYNHRVCKAIDFMVRDALIEADPVFKISDSINNPSEYLKMDDTILNRIEFSDDPRLEKSKKIIKRIRNRDLYKFVDEYLVPNDKPELKETLKKEINEKNIIACQQDNDGLKVSEIMVNKLPLNYGKGKNPVDHVKFYEKSKPNKAFKLERSQVSYLVPEQCEELNIRIFTSDRNKIKPIRKCFERLLKSYDKDAKTYHSRKYED